MRILSVYGVVIAPLLLLLAGCGDLVDPSDLEVHAVEFDSAVSSLEQGEEVQLRALAKAADGTTLSGRRIFWASEDSSVARVSEAGVMIGVSIGTTRIAASAEGKHAVANVTVRAPAVARLVVSPREVTLANRGTGVLSAAATDARGQPLTGRAVQWVSRGQEIVRVDAQGRITAGRAGTTWVVATSEGRSDSARVTVQPGAPSRLLVDGGDGQIGPVAQPLPQPLVARVLDEFDEPLSGVDVQWSVSSGGGQVAPATSRTDAAGRASTTWTLGTVPGQHTTTARVGALSATFQARASVGSVRTIQLSTDSVELVALRETAHITATAQDAAGNVVPDAGITWRSQSPSVATVGSGGRVEAVANGRAVIVASAGGVEQPMVVRVNQRVAGVVLASKQARINAIGFTRPLSAEARDRTGHRVSGAAITWTSLDGSIASVSGTGVVTARAPGTARIRASSGSFADTATVQVVQVVSTVSTTPASETLFTGRLLQMGASAADSSGAPIAGATFQWSSSETSVATVDGQGRVLTLAPGTAQVSATFQGRTGSSTLVVRLVPVHRVVVEPSEVSLARGQTQQLVARAYDAGGSLLTGRTVTWSSSDPDRATVSATGLVTAESPGQATITATVGGVPGTAAVSVNNRRTP